MADAAEKFKSPVPAAVRRQARKAERAHKQTYSPEEKGEDVAKPELVASPQAVEVASKAVQEPPQEVTEVSPTSDPPSPSEAAPEPPKEDWEQKYRTLQGMIDREVREKKSLQQQIDGLQATLGAVTSVKEKPEPEQKAAPTRKLRKEDVDAYGEDMVNVIRAAAHDELMPVINELRAENAQLKEELGGVVATTSKNEVQSTEALLSREVPDWREINESPEFLEWLATEDAFSGQPRYELLRNAGNNGPRVLAFFKAYLNETKAIRGHQEATPQPAPQPVQAQTKGPIVDPTSLVAPGRPASQNAGAGAAVDSEEPKFFTQAQISQFYREVQQGKWRNRPRDKEAREREIHKAAMSGRVKA